MTDESSSQLTVRLREVDGPELERLVERHLEELELPMVRQVLRNPFVTSKVTEILLADARLMAYQEVRRELAGHPKTPKARALRLIATLYWRDILHLARDNRTPPSIRRAAEMQLLSRLAGLSSGEKRSIARLCGPGVIVQLRNDPEPMVIKALLENPRLTEGSLLPMLSREMARPEILSLVANSNRWGTRYPVRVAICKNPRTPATSSLPLLPMLKKKDLAAVARDRRLPAVVTRRAEVLLGET